MIHLACNFKKLMNCTRGNTRVVFRPLNCKCFTWPCLSVCKYADIKSINCWLYQSFGIFKYLLLSWIRAEACIESKCFKSWLYLNVDWELIWNANNYWGLHIFFIFIHRSSSCIDSYFTLHVFQLIVKLLSFENLLFVLLVNLRNMPIHFWELRSRCC